MTRTFIIYALLCTTSLFAQDPKGWLKGRGYGWVYGQGDEVGAINAILSSAHILRAVKEITVGKVYDLGVTVDRNSHRASVHPPTEITIFRTPRGVKMSRSSVKVPQGVAYHNCLLVISDNVGTQIDSLGHITAGDDNHWYNGFREQDHTSDFGLLKADANSIPPIIGRAILIDVASWKGVDALPARFPIGSKELQATLASQKVDVDPGDIVLIRTGAAQYWDQASADHAKLRQHDSAGISLDGAKWLVEQKGAVMIAQDTSGGEVTGDPAMPGALLPVHEYLLIQQGVHIGELHYLEELAREKVYRFTYFATTNRLKGTTAGFALRPVALR
jgi:kynurenine formamidase